MSLRAVLVVVALAACACGQSPATVSARGLPLGDLTVADGGRQVLALTVEIADNQGAQEKGLMGVRSLAADQGMAFLFGQQVDVGFWMKDTLIPLDIAFADAGGRVVDVQHMVPCTADPCTVYQAAAPYSMALEAASGVLSHAGVRTGDVLRLQRRGTAGPTPGG